MGQTKIEWADAVWNPITGCTPVSEGCRNCYARRMAYRLRGRCGYPKDEPFRVTLHPERLEEPLRWKKPKRVFVCSMGDLFHPDVPSKYIQSILKTIFYTAGRLNKGHVYMILTKRPERMRDEIVTFIKNKSRFYHLTKISGLWLGVTAENQQAADERIPILLQTPAAVKFVSVEPMLGPVDLSKWLEPEGWYCENCQRELEPEEVTFTETHDIRQGGCGEYVGSPPSQIDWVIVGGETGPGARPMCPDWVESILYQCKEAGIPFFFKSWGDWAPWYGDEDDGCPGDPECEKINCSGCKKAHFWRFTGGGPAGYEPRGVLFSVRVGKKAAGRLLDGRTWDEFPG